MSGIQSIKKNKERALSGKMQKRYLHYANPKHKILSKNGLIGSGTRVEIIISKDADQAARHC